MSKKYESAIATQQYTPKSIPPVCGNCSNMKFDMELPKWMQLDPDDWDDSCKRATNLRCGIGGFRVKKQGSCAEYAPVKMPNP